MKEKIIEILIDESDVPNVIAQVNSFWLIWIDIDIVIPMLEVLYYLHLKIVFGFFNFILSHFFPFLKCVHTNLSLIAN